MFSLTAFRRLFPCLSIIIVLGAACNPYDYQHGEFNAGPVDAANFPHAYQGEGYDPNVNGYLSGKGKFNEVRAYYNGGPAGYYSFPFTTTQLTSSDPLQLPQDPRRQPQTPNAYVFDPEPPSPFPVTQKCTAPNGYTFDPQSNYDMRLDEQGNIFTQLPFATERPGQTSTFEYIPVVAELPVRAAGLACQSIKSEPTLNRMLGNPSPSGNFLLWAIIDPSSGVYRVGQVSSPVTLPDGSPNPNYSNGIGVQKWGWFGHYYLAYIDGGYVPTQTVNGVLRMKTQPLYIPLRITPAGVRCGSATCQAGQVCSNNTCQSCTGNRPSPAENCPAGQICCPSPQTCFNPGATGTCADFGKVGQGYDVIQSRRSDSNYSPVCEVRQYTANIGSPSRPRQSGELPKSAADVLALSPTTQPPTAESGVPRYVYCPQVD